MHRFSAAGSICQVDAAGGVAAGVHRQQLINAQPPMLVLAHVASCCCYALPLLCGNVSSSSPASPTEVWDQPGSIHLGSIVAVVVGVVLVGVVVG